MRIATWNVNSVKQRVPRLLPWLDERKPDVVCLQETKLTDDAFTALLGEELASRGYQVALSGEAAARGGRVVIAVYVPSGREPDSEHYLYKLVCVDALGERVGSGPRTTIVAG